MQRKHQWQCLRGNQKPQNFTIRLFSVSCPDRDWGSFQLYSHVHLADTGIPNLLNSQTRKKAMESEMSVVREHRYAVMLSGLQLSV